MNDYMKRALDLARRAMMQGEVPVGAVLVSSEDYVLAETRNRTMELHDPTAHAELLAIRQACNITGSERLNKCDLYVTLEPCAMCASAISFARISRLYFGAYDPKSGGVEHGACVYEHPQCHFRPQIYGGILELEASKLLSEFFRGRR